MTRNLADRLASLAIVLVERLGYLLSLAPLLIGRLRTGRWPGAPEELALDIGLGIVILGVALLMGYARRQTLRVDSLRKTLNEAIIHDLKNPLTAIMGCLSCVIEDHADAALRGRLMNLALHSCKSQMNLLETLVDTSRLEHGELVAGKAAIKTAKLLEDCLGDVRGAAAHLGVELTSTTSGALPEEIHGDADLLPRVICNLLHNALKYTPSGGTVSLDVKAGGAGLVFEISDTGIGIGPDQISRLFKKYYRVEGADQSSRRGSGLGLYFCRLVIEAHGGKVAIKSRVGAGTTVVFDIPDCPGARPFMREADRTARWDDRRRRLLLVEDDATVRAALQAALAKDHDVDGLHSGEEALARLASRKPDLLLLDITPPGSDGFEACRALRAAAKQGGVPILFMTNRRDDKTFLDSLAEGGNAFIAKPFAMPQLRERLVHLLQRAP